MVGEAGGFFAIFGPFCATWVLLLERVLAAHILHTCSLDTQDMGKNTLFAGIDRKLRPGLSFREFQKLANFLILSSRKRTAQWLGKPGEFFVIFGPFCATWVLLLSDYKFARMDSIPAVINKAHPIMCVRRHPRNLRPPWICQDRARAPAKIASDVFGIMQIDGAFTRIINYGTNDMDQSGWV